MIFIIAGESSGDLHGAKLIQSLQKEVPSAEFIGHGGDQMQKAGMKIIEHVSSLSMMGFTEVLRHLPYMMRVMRNTVSMIKKIKPTRVILIDYPGFNLRLAKRLQGSGIPITYFILPQVWAWKEKRVDTLKKYVDQRLSIIPFEKPWFGRRNVDVEYVGHPFSALSVGGISKETFFSNHGLDPNKPLLVLLPGSRQQEVDRHWDVYLESVRLLKDSYPDLQVIVGLAKGVSLRSLPGYIHIETDARLALRFGTAALASSGTVTLEAAVLGCPVVVTYKLSCLSWQIAKRVVKVQHASLINLIMDKKVFPEFLQKEMTSDNLVSTLSPLLKESPERRDMILELSKVQKRLGDHNAYSAAARSIRNRILEC